MYPNSIVVVNPSTTAVEKSFFAGGEPMSIRIGSNLAYVGFVGTGSVQQFSLPGFSPTLQWSLGLDPSTGTTLFPRDMQVEPGAPHTVAISVANWWESTLPLEVAIYDDGVQRPVVAPTSFGQLLEYSFLQWDNASTLYAINADTGPSNGFYTLSVNGSGVSLANNYPLTYNNDFRIHFDPGTGYVYEDNGEIIDPTTGVVVYTLPASGLVIPDSSHNRIFVLGQNGSLNPPAIDVAIEVFDQTTYASLGLMPIRELVGIPSNFIRWGNSGLAFATVNGVFWEGGLTGAYAPGPGMLYLIDSAQVNSAITKPANPGAFEHVHAWKRPNPSRLKQER